MGKTGRFGIHGGQYITEVLNGKLGELYSAPQGRITLK